MDKFKKLPPQQKLIIGIVFLGLVAGLFYYSVIMGQDEEIAKQTSQYQAAKRELDGFKDFRGEVEIAEMREKYAQVIKRIEENKAIIPDKDNLPQLMSGLETDALDAGLVVVTKEQKASEEGDYYMAIPIKFEMRGSYLQLARFFKLIAQPGKRLVAPRALDIKMVKTKQSKKGKDDKSPFASGRVASAESELVATMLIEGYTYTGRPFSGKKK
jgi:type IV pilus assembly protein PilO